MHMYTLSSFSESVTFYLPHYSVSRNVIVLISGTCYIIRLAKYLTRPLQRIDHLSRGFLPTVARRCVWSRNLENEEAKARYGAVKIQPQWVVTPRKQTTNI
jgi:hypothetical protein